MTAIPEGRIVLLASPLADLTQPYTALPALSALLRQRDFSVVQRDVSIDLLDHLLTPSSVEASYRQAVSVSRGRMKKCTDFADRVNGFGATVGTLMTDLDDSLRLLRQRRAADDLPAYRRAVRLVNLAFEVLSLPYYPASFGPGHYSTGRASDWKDICAASTCEETNPFIDLFRRVVVPSVIEERPMMVGISITYEFQLIPGLTLARLIKETAATYVVIGGAIIQRLKSFLHGEAQAFRYADSFVIGEGETAIASLASALRAGRVPASAPNTIMSDASGLAVEGPRVVERVRQLPMPDFDGLRLDRYLSPEPVLLVSTTRGCYYGKCAFCDVSTNTGDVCRMPTKDRLADTVRTMNRRHGIRRFMFCDDAMPPSHMTLIAKLVQEEMPDVTWQAEARFERALTHPFLEQIWRGGCRQLIFGLESRSARVLRLMSKNNDPELDHATIRACRAVGIAVNAQTFIGFPGETDAEARLTVDYLLQQRDYIASFGFTTFSLFPNTPVHRNPERYGVRCVEVQRELLQPLAFETSDGMNREHVAALYKESIAVLAKAYKGRSFMLGGPWGAHGLLLLSDVSLDDAWRIWQAQADDECSGGIRFSNIDERILCLPSSVVLPQRESIRPGASCMIFSTETAEYFHVDGEAVALLRAFDGRNDVFSLTASFADALTGDASVRLVKIARAVAMAAEFARLGLLREVVTATS